MPSRNETPYSAPGAPSTWRTRGLVTVGEVAQAVDELIVRAVFINIAKIYRKKVSDFKTSLLAAGVRHLAAKVLAKELLDDVLRNLTRLLTFFRERRFQEDIRAAIRKGYLKTARSLWEGKLFQNKKVRGRRIQYVRTRIPDTGKKSETRGPQLEMGHMLAPRKSDEGAEDIDEGLGFFLGKGKKK